MGGDPVVWALTFLLFAFVTAILGLLELAVITLAVSLLLAAVVSVLGEGSI